MVKIDLAQTLQSGQCFRFSEKNGLWTVYSGLGKDVKVLSVSQNDLSPITNDSFWYNFFDLAMDYDSLKTKFATLGPIMEKACGFAPGITILNQNPWEALCSFVVSQNNNIKRIMSIVDRMCKSFGEQDGKGNFGFPTAQDLAGASDESLRSVGLGFRAPYIINTAEAVCNKKVNFDELKTEPIELARKQLMQIKGIGPKVADCALLFGCHRLDCFPMDVWMKKVMSVHFPGRDASYFGPYAGVAQQYLFHWARTSGELNDL